MRLYPKLNKITRLLIILRESRQKKWRKTEWLMNHFWLAALKFLTAILILIKLSHSRKQSEQVFSTQFRSPTRLAKWRKMPSTAHLSRKNSLNLSRSSKISVTLPPHSFWENLVTTRIVGSSLGKDTQQTGAFLMRDLLRGSLQKPSSQKCLGMKANTLSPKYTQWKTRPSYLKKVQTLTLKILPNIRVAQVTAEAGMHLSGQTPFQTNFWMTSQTSAPCSWIVPASLVRDPPQTSRIPTFYSLATLPI